jgi:hypothetical protein
LHPAPARFSSFLEYRYPSSASKGYYVPQPGEVSDSLRGKLRAGTVLLLISGHIAKNLPKALERYADFSLTTDHRVPLLNLATALLLHVRAGMRIIAANE